MRDVSKSVAYGAELHAFTNTLLGEQQDFASLVSTTREVEATPEWQHVYGNTPLNIISTRGCHDYARGFTTIAYKTIGSWRFAVPHEMAHILTDDRHGPSWRARYVWLVRIMYGNEWAEALIAGFDSSKLSVVSFPVARTTPMLPPELFDAQVGSPLFAPTTNAPARAIAL
jgi:hypothetical protein